MTTNGTRQSKTSGQADGAPNADYRLSLIARAKEDLAKLTKLLSSNSSLVDPSLLASQAHLNNYIQMLENQVNRSRK